MLEFLFVPQDESISSFLDIIESKFSFVDYIVEGVDSLKNILTNWGSAPKFYIDIGSTKYTPEMEVCIDFSWYEPYKPYADIIITGFIYASFLWRIFIKLPGIVSGTAGYISVVDTDSSFFSKRSGR